MNSCLRVFIGPRVPMSNLSPQGKELPEPRGQASSYSLSQGDESLNQFPVPLKAAPPSVLPVLISLVGGPVVIKGLEHAVYVVLQRHRFP
jgi:hypothetical protein